MPKTIQIEINAPIWKNRSVGISLAHADPEDTVEITIAYTRKSDGKKPFPFIYELYAKEIHRYGITYIMAGKVPLYEVPIKDFRIKNYKSNKLNQKKETMIFDNTEIQKIRKENKEKFGGDKRPKVPAGEHLMTLKTVKLDYSKTDKAPMVVAEFEKDEQHRSIYKYWKLASKGSESHRSQLIDFLERSFGYILQPCNSEEDVIKQLTQYCGKKMKAAIQHQMSVFQKDGKTTVFKKPEIWYFGAEAEASFTMDPTKHVRQLDAKEMEKLNEIRKLGGEVTFDDDETKVSVGNTSVPAGGNTTDPATIAESITEQNKVDDGLPF